MHSRRDETLAKRVLLDEAFQQIPSDGEVVEQCVAFDRRPESENLPALLPLIVQKTEAFFFFDFDVARKLAIRFDFIPSARAFLRLHHFKTRRPLFRSCMRDEADDGAAVNRRKIAIEHHQAVPLKQRLNGFEVVVQKMLVINLIESQIFDDLLHVKELDDKHAVVFQRAADAFGDGMQFLEMEEDPGSIDHIELSAQRLSDFFIEECLQRLDAAAVSNRRS